MWCMIQQWTKNYLLFLLHTFWFRLHCCSLYCRRFTVLGTKRNAPSQLRINWHFHCLIFPTVSSLLRIRKMPVHWPFLEKSGPQKWVVGATLALKENFLAGTLNQYSCFFKASFSSCPYYLAQSRSNPKATSFERNYRRMWKYSAWDHLRCTLYIGKYIFWNYKGLDFTWGIILAKAKERGPNLLDVITAICWGRKEQNIHSSGITWIAPIGTIYSILLHQVNRELNLVQPINTVLLANSQAEIKACERGQSPLIYPANKDKVPLFSFSFI